MNRWERRGAAFADETVYARLLGAARETSRAYAAAGSPLRALSALDPPPPGLHLYAQPDAAEYFAAQQSFSAANPWFLQVAPSQKGAAAPAPPAG